MHQRTTQTGSYDLAKTEVLRLIDSFEYYNKPIYRRCKETKKYVKEEDPVDELSFKTERAPYPESIGPNAERVYFITLFKLMRIEDMIKQWINVMLLKPLAQT